MKARMSATKWLLVILVAISPGIFALWLGIYFDSAFIIANGVVMIAAGVASLVRVRRASHLTNT
jgi:hypothetical protein